MNQKTAFLRKAKEYAIAPETHQPRFRLFILPFHGARATSSGWIHVTKRLAQINVDKGQDAAAWARSIAESSWRSVKMGLAALRDASTGYAYHYFIRDIMTSRIRE